jgi:hypothetical protein
LHRAGLTECRGHYDFGIHDIRFAVFEALKSVVHSDDLPRSKRRELMNKLLTMLTAAALALTLSGFAAAADKDPNAQQPQAQQPADPAAGGSTASQRDQEYLAALKKCEPLTGAEKTKCVDVAKKKFGQM